MALNRKEMKRFRELYIAHMDTILSYAESDIQNFPHPDPNTQKELSEMFELYRKARSKT